MKRSSRSLIASLVTVLLLTAVTTGQDARTPQPADGGTSPQPLPAAVGFRVFQWSYQAEDGSDKPLAVAVWYPAAPGRADDAEQSTVTYGNGVAGLAGQDAPPDTAGGSYPLIVWSHGFTGSAISYAYLCERLAAAGYVVAAPDHNDPVSSMRISGPVEDDDLPAKRRQALTDLMTQQEDFDHDQYAYRPTELALTIDNLLAQSDAEPGDDAPLSGMVDADRIGAGGHSMGGYTVLARIGCLPSATDERITVAVLQSPGSWMWQAEDYRTIAIPTMYMLGQWEAGREAKLTNTERAFDNSPEPTWQIEIARAGHGIFADPHSLDADRLGPLADKIMAERFARADTIVRYTVAMFDRTLKADDPAAVEAANAALAEDAEWTSRFAARPQQPLLAPAGDDEGGPGSH